MSESAPEEPETHERLKCQTKAAYSFLRMPLSAIDFVVRPARTSVYIETLGMGIHTQAMIISACKSLDFLLGFIVGYASDNLKTRWGRRKPFIALLCPIFIACTLFLCNPPTSLGMQQAPSHTYCQEEFDPTIKHNCSALFDCVHDKIMNGTLAAQNDPNGGGTANSSVSAGLGLSARQWHRYTQCRRC